MRLGFASSAPSHQHSLALLRLTAPPLPLLWIVLFFSQRVLRAPQIKLQSFLAKRLAQHTHFSFANAWSWEWHVSMICFPFKRFWKLHQYQQSQIVLGPTFAHARSWQWKRFGDFWGVKGNCVSEVPPTCPPLDTAFAALAITNQ